MRMYKEDTICIRINPILKDKFHIAVGFAGVSATINSFINQYVRDYEKQYGLIPVTITDAQKYDIVTKFFGVSINKKLIKKYNLEETLKVVNEKLGTNIELDQMIYFIENYPKTRQPEDFQKFIYPENKI